MNGMTGSLASKELNHSPESRPPVAASRIGIAGGVFTVKSPETNCLAATATARRTVGSGSLVSAWRRSKVPGNQYPRSPVSRADHARMAGSGSVEAASSRPSSRPPEECRVHSAASRASRWVHRGTGDGGRFPRGGCFLRRKVAAFREDPLGGVLLPDVGVGEEFHQLLAAGAGEVHVGRGAGGHRCPGWSPVCTTRQTRPCSRSTPAGSALAFW